MDCIHELPNLESLNYVGIACSLPLPINTNTFRKNHSNVCLRSTEEVREWCQMILSHPSLKKMSFSVYSCCFCFLQLPPTYLAAASQHWEFYCVSAQLPIKFNEHNFICKETLLFTCHPSSDEISIQVEALDRIAEVVSGVAEMLKNDQPIKNLDFVCFFPCFLSPTSQ